MQQPVEANSPNTSDNPVEWFEFFGVTYDVQLARTALNKGLIKAKIVDFPVEEYVKALRIPIDRNKPMTNAAQGVPMLIRLNWDHVAKLTEADLKVPGIAAETKFGSVLIDGNHRLVRAYMDGRETIPVYHITKKNILNIIKGSKGYSKLKRATTASIIPYVVEAQGNVNREFYLGELHFNQETGKGQVPDNMDVDYKGFAVIMTPRQFHALVAPRTYNDESLAFITDAIKNGEAIGSPFLSILKDKKGRYRVSGHEGRTRMKAISDVYGQVPVLVHIFADWTRAEKLSAEIINAIRNSLIPEKQDKALKGPHFGPKVHLKGQWLVVREPTDSDSVLARILSIASSEWINDKYKRDLLGRLRDAVSDLDFFNTDLDCIQKFETLLREIGNRNQQLEPSEGTTS